MNVENRKSKVESRKSKVEIGCAVVAALLTGCAAKPGPGFTVLRTMPPAGEVAAGDIYPLVAGQWTYLVTQGDEQGSRVVFDGGGTDRYDAAWSNRQGDRRVEFWRGDDQGNVVMTAVIEHGDRAITLFSPPLVIAYDRLSPGDARTQEVAMRVMDERRPTRVRDEGTATRTIEYVGDEQLKTPLGRILTRRIEISFLADLKLANAETRTTLWVAPGAGPVVEQRRDTVRMLGVPIRSSAQTLVLVESPVPVVEPRAGASSRAETAQRKGG